jgi:hypothetical protein
VQRKMLSGDLAKGLIANRTRSLPFAPVGDANVQHAGQIQTCSDRAEMAQASNARHGGRVPSTHLVRAHMLPLLGDARFPDDCRT